MSQLRCWCECVGVLVFWSPPVVPVSHGRYWCERAGALVFWCVQVVQVPLWFVVLVSSRVCEREFCVCACVRESLCVFLPVERVSHRGPLSGTPDA